MHESDSTSNRFLSTPDVIYICSIGVSSVFLAYHFAGEFDMPLLGTRVFASLIYFSIALCLTFVHVLSSRTTRWPIAIAGGLLGLFVASITYSIVRQELVLIVYPSLFCLPGALFGAVVANAVLEKTSRRSAATDEPIAS